MAVPCAAVPRTAARCKHWITLIFASQIQGINGIDAMPPPPAVARCIKDTVPFTAGKQSG